MCTARLPVSAPSAVELQQIVARIARRVGRCLERAGWLRREDDSLERDGLERLRSQSILYRIALGPHAGRKVFTLQTQPAGLHCPAGGADSAAAGEPDALPWRVRTQQSTTGADHARRSRQAPRRDTGHAGAAASSSGLGAAAEARVPARSGTLHSLWGCAEVDGRH